MDIQKRLEAQQVRDVYANSGFATFAMFILASFLTVYLWEHMTHSIILGWYFTNILAIAMHYAFYYNFRKAASAGVDYPKWNRIITLSFTLRGIAFGSSGILLFSDNPGNQITLIGVLAGMVGGSVGSYHMMKHIAFLFCVAFVAPLSYSLFTYQFETYTVLGIFSLIYMASMAALSLKLNKTYIDNVILRFNTESLTDLLKLETREKDKANAELQAQFNEAVLLKNEWESTFNSVADIIFVLDKDHRIRRANKTAFEKLNIDEKDLTGKHCYEIIHCSDSPVQGCPHSLLLRDGEHRSIELFEKSLDGYFRISVYPMHNLEGGLTGSVHILHDITKARLNEEALRENEERYRALVNTSPLGIHISDLNGKITLSNPAHHEIMQAPDGSLIGRHLWDLLADDVDKEQLEEFYQYLIKEQPEPTTVYNVNRTLAGNLIDVKVDWQYIRDASGNLAGFCSIVEDITEKKRMEEELAYSQGFLKSIIDNEPECVKLLESDGTLVDMNPSGLAMIEADDIGQVRGKNITEVVAPEHKEAFALLTRKVCEGESGTLEFRIVGHRGTEKWLETHAVPFYDEKRKVPLLLAVTRDITEKKMIENELRANAAIFDNLAEGVYLIGADDLTIKWTNPVFENMFGYGKGELIGQQVDILNALSEMTPEETKEAIVTVLREKGEWHGEVQNIKKDGTHFWCHANISIFDHFEFGKVMVSVHTDITRRKRAQQQLNAISNEKDELIKKLDMLYRAIETTQVGVTICDNERKIIYVNEADARMHGYSVGELLGRKTAVYISKAAEGQKKLADIRLKDGWVRESINVDKGGREFPVLLSSVHIIDHEGRSNAMVTVCEDITELKENEEKLKQALQQREMLIKEVHHRVKNNLAVIQSLLRLQSSQSKEASAKYALDESQSRVRAMGMIHERLYQSNDLSSMDFADYMRSLADQLYENYCNNRKDISLRIDIPKISIDVDTIIPCGLIVNELLTNAFKYAFPEGRKGEVFIGIEYDDAGQMSLVVRDNGVGLPEGFDIKKSGSLGMKIVDSLSKQIGTDVQIRSDGSRTEFRVMLLKAGLQPLEWDDKHHLTGHEVIDKQHRQLYEAIENLKYAIESGRHDEGVGDVIPALLHYVDEHFRTEEEIMVEHEYPAYDSHKKAHGDFREKVGRIVAEIKDGRRGLSLSIFDFLANWLIDHIGETDKELAVFMKGKGLISPGDPPAGKSRPQRGNYQILTIEDDRLAQMAMSRFLQKQGYSYLTASSGKDAIEAFKNNNFELIVSDIMLPDMDGIETVTEIRKSGVEIPVLFLTGKDTSEISEQLKGLNVLGVLPKPVSFPDMKKVLEDYLSR